VLPAGKGLNYLPRMAFSSTRFSLWILVLARTQPHRLKPVLLERAGQFGEARKWKSFSN